jgi:hypothetical protein
MKKLLLLVLFCTVGLSVAKAQLPGGTTAPDFTGTDLNGNTVHLYDLLNAGKTVYLDMFATWCGPCWNYHNGHALKTIWETYGPDGTNEAYVMAIECDGSTNVACLYGPSGCVGGTQGDWVTGTPYPFIDDAGIGNLYNVNYYPTIYMICPDDKKVWEPGQLSASGLWNYRATKCAAAPLSLNLDGVGDVRCFGTATGSINISTTGGTAPFTYHWSNNASTQDVINLLPGNYSCTVTSNNGSTAVIGPITVSNPPTALSVGLEDATPAGCNGIQGSLTATGVGGWGNYSYAWSNGQNNAQIIGLTPGNYTVTVTDDNNCAKTSVFTVAPPVNPTAAIIPPSLINCNQPAIQINGSNSSTGPNFSYQWFVSNGGNIVSGGTTPTPTVNAAGNYTLQVTNTENTCVAYASTPVASDVAAPTANAGAAMTISCTQTTTVLQGSGSSGNNFSYLWTASNGGNITSGANTLTPTVNASGTYTLRVTNSTNGCTKTSATTVSGTAGPSLNTTNGSVTCFVPVVTLTTSTNATHPGFAWTGPNNYSSSQQSPSVNVAGVYSVVVMDSITGCTSTATAMVASNNSNPGANAAGGSITCLNLSVILNASTPDTNAVFAWTGPNNFTSSLQNPTVSMDGAYNVVVLDTLNGCTSAATATVALNNTTPTAAAATPGNLNCNAAQLQLSGTGSSLGGNMTYNWSTVNGNIVSGGNTLTPIVDLPGTYNLLVSNTDNGCTANAGTSVVLNQPVSTAVTTMSNVSCNGALNGAATVGTAGGNGTYAYNWSNGANTASISNVAAGTYVVVVTDGENCTATTAVNITQPDPLNANASATAQSANGLNDGTATAVPAGGTAVYTYAWSNNETTQTINGLAPGTYTVTVGDANGCSAVQTVNVNAFNCTISANVSAANISCFGSNNGSATVSLTGANLPVTYNWSNGANTETASNLAPGEYTVNVMDANNCPAVLNVTIQEPTALNANATATNEGSAGANNGAATANPVGGSAPYTYAWSTGATDQSISGLAPGTYTVIVTDQNACSSVQSVNVDPFSCNIAAQSIVLNISCAGSANGSVSVSLNGGTAPFNYTWNTGANTGSIANLPVGDYTATVTDANGCETVAAASVTEPAPFSPWSTTVVNTVCANDPSGAATVSISGGTAPYAYNWSNGASGSEVSGLTPGAYTVTVADQNNCQTSQTVNIVATDNVPPAVSVQNATLFLGGNGTVSVTMAALSGEASDNCAVASTVITPSSFDCDQLGNQVVTVIVTDASGLTSQASAVVTIRDNIAPVLTCPNSITRCAYDNVVSYPAPVAVDNCLLASGGEWQLESGLPSGSEFPIGVTTNIYSFTDPSGNAGTCSFEVIVSAPVAFEAPAITNDVNNAGVGSITVNMTGGVSPLSFRWFHDGAVVGTEQNLFNVKAGLYTLEVVDANGCIYRTADLEVSNVSASREPVWLSGVRMQPNPTSGITRVVFEDIPTTTLEISVIDAMGRVLVSEISDNQSVITLNCTELPAGMYTVRFRTSTETGIRKLVVNR